MNTKTKKLLTLGLAIVMLIAVAAGIIGIFGIGGPTVLYVGDNVELPLSETPYTSSIPELVKFKDKGDNLYTFKVLDTGTFTISGGSMDGQAMEDLHYTVREANTVFEKVVMLIYKYWNIFLIEGLSNTLLLTVIAVTMGAILGAGVAILKMSKIAVIRFLISIYIEVIRGTPILLQLYIFYFVLPEMFPILNLSSFMWVAIALCINSSAYVSEVFRSGIQAVDKGQTEAARSLGLSASQTMIKIVLPQAIRNILPALGNEFIMILKETSLASTFFLGDLMTSYLKVKGATYLGFEALIIVGIIYFCMTFPLSKVVEAFEKKMSSDKSYKKRKKAKKVQEV